VAEKTGTKNAFEFVTIASARARQLLTGCTPRVAAPSARQARTAMAEVRAGEVGKSGEQKRKMKNEK